MKTQIAVPLMLGAALISANAAAGKPGTENRTFDERAMVRSADLVLQGVVERVEYKFSDAQDGRSPRLPHTFVTYRIEDVIRGAAPGETITLRFIGGRGEEASFLTADPLPLFDVGDRDVLLVAGNTQRGCPLVRCAAGRLRVIDDHIFTDEGAAVEQDENGALRHGAFYDLPDVMTHHVSQTVLTRRDHFEPGESREAFVLPAGGAHLSAAELRTRLRAAARAAGESAVRAQSADISQSFVIGAAASPARAGALQERVELDAT